MLTNASFSTSLTKEWGIGAEFSIHPVLNSIWILFDFFLHAALLYMQVIVGRLPSRKLGS